MMPRTGEINMTTKAATLRHTHHAHHMPAWEQWLVRHRHKFGIAASVIVLVALCSVFWQVNYPADQALPSLKLGGLDVGGKDRAAIVAQLTDYAQKGEVTITSPSREWKAKWQSIGLNVDAEASADAAIAYEQWERLIPFSAPLRAQRTAELPLIALVDEDRLHEFATKLVAEDKQAAQDATISVKDGVVAVDEAKNGYVYNIDEVKQQVQASAVAADAKLRLAPQQVGYVRSAKELAAAKTAAENIVAHRLSLKVGEHTFSPDAKIVGSWLQFPEDPKTKQLTAALDGEAIRHYLTDIDEKTKIAPGTSTVTLLDGQEVARTPAAAGRSVAADGSIQQIQTALTGQELKPQIELATAAVPPKVTYVRTYSQSNAGIAAIIRDWDATHYGDYAVIVRELGGQGRYAEYQPDKPYVTSSTFKLFTYYAVQDRIQKGLINYQTTTDMGWSVDACLQEMIVRSTNPCAISLMNMVGWQESQDIVTAGGFPATFINNQAGGDKYSTVRDESNYFMRLYYGTLMGQEATDRLLGYLKRQIWRAGIPAGVPAGVTVADKVGFYNGWVHDIAIVYGPKSTYILAIMSKGGSDPAFANLSSRMHNFFLH
jgi:beta-lactamase class A